MLDKTTNTEAPFSNAEPRFKKVHLSSLTSSFLILSISRSSALQKRYILKGNLTTAPSACQYVRFCALNIAKYPSVEMLK